ncbi:MAG: glycosyltransferase [Candidatus Brocadia sp.]|nr:N-acetylglucosaminyldiphosphoundecaprenol N-acetyl-beta-D-mannosaminyltransferase [Candidatus Brocadia fulgida]RIJ94567.1 MAG: glycosyltransferase [Candidatus Brocadia sp.]
MKIIPSNILTLARETVWNIQVHVCSLQQVLENIDEGVDANVMNRVLCCANPHSLVIAHKDKEFLSALRSADLLIPDGIGIVLASRLAGGNITTRVSGPDVLVRLAAHWNKRNDRSFFFLGSSTEVLEMIRLRLHKEFPNIQVSGIYSPPFKEEFSEKETAEMIERINSASPTALCVGMTAPRQEKWIFKNKDRLKVPIICAIGAAFDYFAGTKKRAPQWVQNIGLEWLPRLMREPKRLWKRNVISTPVFLFHTIKQHFISAV